IARALKVHRIQTAAERTATQKVCQAVEGESGHLVSAIEDIELCEVVVGAKRQIVFAERPVQIAGAFKRILNKSGIGKVRRGADIQRRVGGRVKSAHGNSRKGRTTEKIDAHSGGPE